MNNRESGFTLIELIIGILLVALISIAVGLLLGMMYKVNAGSLHRETAIRQVQNAGMWVTEDVQRAQTVTPGTGSRLLEVVWTDWDGTKYKVDYDYGATVTNDLVRTYYVTNMVTPAAITVIANYIDHATSFVQSGNVYILTVTAKITGYSANGQPTIETRKYEILPRPGS